MFSQEYIFSYYCGNLYDTRDAITFYASERLHSIKPHNEWGVLYDGVTEIRLLSPRSVKTIELS